MWEILLANLLKDVIVPELFELIKTRFNETGQWPTKEEMDKMVEDKKDLIVARGTEFLNRPKKETLAFNDDGM